MKQALETLFCVLKSYLQSFVMMMMITFFQHIILSLMFLLYMHSSTKNLKLFERYIKLGRPDWKQEFGSKLKRACLLCFDLSLEKSFKTENLVESADRRRRILPHSSADFFQTSHCRRWCLQRLFEIYKIRFICATSDKDIAFFHNKCQLYLYLCTCSRILPVDRLVCYVVGQKFCYKMIYLLLSCK